jgi:hypothetical protein
MCRSNSKRCADTHNSCRSALCGHRFGRYPESPRAEVAVCVRIALAAHVFSRDSVLLQFSAAGHWILNQVINMIECYLIDWFLDLEGARRCILFHRHD